jgi:hypothetical protein
MSESTRHGEIRRGLELLPPHPGKEGFRFQEAKRVQAETVELKSKPTAHSRKASSFGWWLKSGNRQTEVLFVWLVADGWCWFVLREKYCWLVAGGWFVLREKYCWLVADKPNEQAVRRHACPPATAEKFRSFLNPGRRAGTAAVHRWRRNTAIQYATSGFESRMSMLPSTYDVLVRTRTGPLFHRQVAAAVPTYN